MDDASRRREETLTFLNAKTKDVTIAARAEKWVANVQANRAHFAQGNPPLLGLTAFVVAAGPSLRKNVAELRRVGRLGVIVCVDASYRFLVKNGVTPDYCVTIDADPRMVTMVEGTDTRRTTLVAQASASPELVAYWKGPKYFLRATGGEKDLDDKLHAAHRVVKAKRAFLPGEQLDPVQDIDVEFAGLNEALVCGGNVTTYAHSFALSLLRAARVVFVGADYAWPLDLEAAADEDFYAGGEHQKLARERLNAEQVFSHKTPDGECQTNFTLYHLKTWHDELAAAHPGHCVNATEGGILGLDRDGQRQKAYEHLPLAEAVDRFTLPQAVPA